MKSIVTAALTTLVLVASAAWADDYALRVALQSRYAEMKSAMTAHDGTGVAAILAPNFESIDISGQSENGSQMIAEVNALKPDPNKWSETTIVKIEPAADAVTVEQRYHMKTIKVSADGASHNVELITLSTDTWVRKKNAWLMKLTVTDEMSYFKDGALVLHKTKAI